MSARTLYFVLFWLISLHAEWLYAHPSNPNMAITAPTVAEVHVTTHEIRLRAEIGSVDRPVFLDAITDGPQTEPTASQRRFMARGWVIEMDEQPLRGQVTIVEQRRRQKRDPITGEVMPPAGPPLDLVTFLEIRYPLTSRPANIHFKPPKAADGATATIGMVVVHQGMPVCDFDFFKLPVGFRLDWDDPWKSRFRGLRFQRYYNSPMWGTLSIEPRDVRVEIVVRPSLAQLWLDGKSTAGLPSIRTLPALGAQVQQWLQQHITAEINGQVQSLRAEPVAYVQQKLAKIEAISNWADVPPEAVYLQLTFVASVPRRPNQTQVQFQLFHDRLTEFILWVNAGTNPPKITQQEPQFVWKDQSSAEDTLLKFTPTPRPRWVVSLATVGVGVVALGWLIWGGPIRGIWKVASLVALCILAVSLWPIGQVGIGSRDAEVPAPEPEQAKRMVHRMLADAYQAFDCRDEEAIYDTLAESVSGPLLREAYLSIRKMLDMPNQAGRARVKEVVVQSSTFEPRTDGLGYTAQAVWVMEVAISHWGHTHTRLMQYEGVLTIRPHNGRWKIDTLTINDEKLADPKQLTTMPGKSR